MASRNKHSLPQHHYIIYLSGLGERYDRIRELSLKTWRLFGVKTELVALRWYDDRSYEDKKAQVIAAVKQAEAGGYTVSLIGESAGGSMAINVAVMFPRLHRLVTIGGANNPRIPVSPRILKRAPAFKRSLRELTKSLPQLDVKRTSVVRSWHDPVVLPRYTHIEGAQDHRLFLVGGHLFMIIMCLTILSGYIVALVRQRPY